ncbi:MAG TPA: hypothetical protein VKH82_14040 [Candidatus Binatia bacterium]|nr:hypothetical protein [Candidatus Binatia bacterium]
MSARRDAALTTLRRLGLEVDGAAAADLSEAQLDPLLDGPDAAGLAEALGEVGGAGAARALARRATGDVQGALRRTLRRALFRLQQRGVPVPAQEAQPLRVPVGGPELEGLVSAFEGNGDRLIWLAKPRAGGATLLVAAEVNEPDGLRDVRLAEVTRKDLRALRDRLQKQSGLRLVPAPWDVLDALIVEGHERAATGSASASPDRSRDYLRLRPELVHLPPIPPTEPRSPLAAPPSDDERPLLVAGSGDLLTLPELRTWWPRPDAAAPFVKEISALRESPIVLNRMQQEDRLQAVLVRAASALYPPLVVARRLEGTAYVLAETGRVAAARSALAAAGALRAGAGADEVPLLRALVHQGLGTILASEETQRQEERRGSLVLTPSEALTDPASSRRGHTRG